MSTETYAIGQQVKISNKWYYVIMALGGSHGIKVTEDMGDIDRTARLEDSGTWVDVEFIQESRPVPEGVTYSRYAKGYSVKYMSQSQGGDSYVVTDYETGEEIGDYVHATKQSAQLEVKALIAKEEG